MNGYFHIPSLLEELESNKTFKDFKKSDVCKAIQKADESGILGKFAKLEYRHAVLYWAAPTYGAFYENGEDWKTIKNMIEQDNRKGFIYLVLIGDNLWKFGRTANVRKRFNGYPKGSELIRYQAVDDMFESEKILLNCANESNGRVFTAKEYYKFPDAEEPVLVFEKALTRIIKDDES